MNLWGEQIQPKQTTTKSAPVEKQEKKPADFSIYTPDYMATHEVTSESPIQHFAVRLNIVFAHMARFEHFYAELVKRADFEEKKRIELTEVLNKINVMQVEMHNDLEQMNLALEELAGIDEDNDEEECEEPHNPATDHVADL